MKVTVFPYRERINTGNIIWKEKFPMKCGKFPLGHPVGGGPTETSEYGDGQNIRAFREMGYWASCFPEGDGITWKPKNNQSDEKAMQDIKEAFGWDAQWPPNT